MKRILFLAAFAALGAASLAALDIFPIDRAQILAGEYFDFKVELDGNSSAKDVSITINGKDYSTILGAKATYIEREADVGLSAFILRKVRIAAAGSYEVTVTDGPLVRKATWTVYPAAAKAVAKNVIFLIADGLSVCHRTAARLMAKGNTEGSSNGLLAMDQMERLGFVGTSSVDAITVDSANSMSAYMTGHKGSINGLGVYADRTKDPFDDPRVETMAEILRRTTTKSIGIVSDAELEDATPAAVVAHTRLRDEKAAIVQSFLDAKPEVLLGGGSAYFIPKSVAGSKRKDETNFVELFKAAGYGLATSKQELASLAASSPARILGLFPLRRAGSWILAPLESRKPQNFVRRNSIRSPPQNQHKVFSAFCPLIEVLHHFFLPT